MALNRCPGCGYNGSDFLQGGCPIPANCYFNSAQAQIDRAAILHALDALKLRPPVPTHRETYLDRQVANPAGAANHEEADTSAALDALERSGIMPEPARTGKPPFTMSKYASELDLLRDKCAWQAQMITECREQVDWFAAENERLEAIVDGTEYICKRCGVRHDPPKTAQEF